MWRLINLGVRSICRPVFFYINLFSSARRQCIESALANWLLLYTRQFTLDRKARFIVSFIIIIQKEIRPVIIRAILNSYSCTQPWLNMWWKSCRFVFKIIMRWNNCRWVVILGLRWVQLHCQRYDLNFILEAGSNCRGLDLCLSGRFLWRIYNLKDKRLKAAGCHSFIDVFVFTFDFRSFAVKGLTMESPHLWMKVRLGIHWCCWNCRVKHIVLLA